MSVSRSVLAVLLLLPVLPAVAVAAAAAAAAVAVAVAAVAVAVGEHISISSAGIGELLQSHALPLIHQRVVGVREPWHELSMYHSLVAALQPR